jgi:hypothetical protein
MEVIDDSITDPSMDRSSAIAFDHRVKHVKSLEYRAYTVSHFHSDQLISIVLSIIDAVPKKRGPKTDVLEALLKRIDGLEKQLQPEDELASSSARGEGPSRQAELAGGSQTASRSSSTPTRSEDLPEFTSSVSPNIGSGLTDAQKLVISRPVCFRPSLTRSPVKKAGHLPLNLTMSSIISSVHTLLVWMANLSTCLTKAASEQAFASREPHLIIWRFVPWQHGKLDDKTTLLRLLTSMQSFQSFWR